MGSAAQSCSCCLLLTWSCVRGRHFSAGEVHSYVSSLSQIHTSLPVIHSLINTLIQHTHTQTPTSFFPFLIAPLRWLKLSASIQRQTSSSDANTAPALPDAWTELLKLWKEGKASVLSAAPLAAVGLLHACVEVSALAVDL